MAEQQPTWKKLADVTCRHILEQRVRSIERHHEAMKKLPPRPPIIEQIARVRAEG